MNKSHIRIHRKLLIGIGAIIFIAGCSNDNSDSVRPFAAKATLTLSKYYNDQGAMTLPVWEQSSQAGMLTAGAGKSEAFHATPILAGSQKSLFLFTLDVPH